MRVRLGWRANKLSDQMRATQTVAAARATLRRTLGLDQTATDSIADESSHVMDRKFLHDPATMRLGCLGGDAQQICDLLACFTLGN
jgi:hypothetical protein